MRIIFLGTPSFAVASLEALVNAGFEVVGVVTAPDKPAGRGLQLQPSAVKQFALSHGLTVLQPPKLKDPEFLESLRALRADLQVVVAFRMLPEAVWNMPPMGTVNVHASLLPQYRGAAPINWAIINGETETGVTTFQLQHEIDTGGILLQQSLPVGPDEDAGSLHDRIMNAGAELLVQTVQGLQAGRLKPRPQTGTQSSLRSAPKIFTDTARIRWDRPLDEVYNLIRGLAPFPGAFAEVQGQPVKIFRARKATESPRTGPGAMQTDRKTYLRFSCTDGWLYAEELQWPGKKRMGVEEFLRGNGGKLNLSSGEKA